MATINDLPNEILLQILSYTNAQFRIFRCAQVCRRWNDLIMNDKKFLRNIVCVLNEFELFTLDRVPSYLGFYDIKSSSFSSLSFVRHLRVHGCVFNLSANHVLRLNNVLFSYFRNIKILELVDFSILTKGALLKLGGSLKQLEQLLLKKYSLETSDSYFELKKFCNLRKIVLVFGYDLCDEHFECFLRDLKKVNSIWVFGSKKLTDAAMSYLPNYLDRSESIQELGLKGSNITDDGFCNLSVCKSLKRLYVEDAKNIKLKSLNVILSLPNLEKLTLHKASDEVLHVLKTDKRALKLISESKTPKKQTENKE